MTDARSKIFKCTATNLLQFQIMKDYLFWPDPFKKSLKEKLFFEMMDV